MFNLPGKVGWLTMEAPGFITLLYIMNTLPKEIGIETLPWENLCMAGLFVRSIYKKTRSILIDPHQTIHYLYRAILYPLIAPSISPIHVIIWLSAICFQLTNSISIGGWLAGYGATTSEDWANHQSNYEAPTRLCLGLLIWAAGFFLTIFHDDELRKIRRTATQDQRRQAAEAEASTGKGKAANGRVNVDKIYIVPQNGMFKWILYPHYLFEWMEWTGYCIMGGATFIPGQTFVFNEIATMLPRAVKGKKWYIDRFGKEKIGARKAIIPGVL
jgi:3-oxo-5-alpha-steroid 4-dehydrogenase 1